MNSRLQRRGKEVLHLHLIAAGKEGITQLTRFKRSKGFPKRSIYGRKHIASRKPRVSSLGSTNDPNIQFMRKETAYWQVVLVLHGRFFEFCRRGARYQYGGKQQRTATIPDPGQSVAQQKSAGRRGKQGFG